MKENKNNTPTSARLPIRTPSHESRHLLVLIRWTEDIGSDMRAVAERDLHILFKDGVCLKCGIRGVFPVTFGQCRLGRIGIVVIRIILTGPERSLDDVDGSYLKCHTGKEYLLVVLLV